MQNNRRLWLTAGILLAALGSGCQTFRHDGASAGSGPSRSFGLDYVPRQSEPSLESPDDGSTAGSRSSKVNAASLQEPADEASPKPKNSLTRLLPGRDKDPPQSQPLPVSSRNASVADSGAGSREDDSE